MDVVVFLLDGCRADAINEKNAPIINELANKGLNASCTTIYPSLTGPGHISLLTGMYPESTGIVDHFYWDSEGQILHDIFNDSFCQTETIFEILSQNGVKGVNFGAYMRRGSKDSYTRKTIRKLAGKVASWKFLMDYIDNRPTLYKFLRGYVVGRYNEFREAYEIGENRFYYVTLSEVDKAGHKYGPESNEYYETIMSCDEKVGETIKLADSLERDTAFIITSDHGQTTLDEKVSLDTMNLDDIGYRMDDSYNYSGAQIVTYNKEENNMAVAAVVSRHVQIWMKNKKDAHLLTKAFANKKGVTYVKTKEENRSDRLYHERLGDVSFCLKPGYGFDFLKIAENGDHGGIDPADMNVPLIIYHKDSKFADPAQQCHTVDVVPTVLRMLGFDPSSTMHGNALIT